MWILDNSRKIALTNSELLKIIHTFYTSAHERKNLEKTEKEDIGPHLRNNLHYFGIAFTKSAPDAGIMQILSTQKLWIILVKLQFYDQIIQISGLLICELMGYEKPGGGGGGVMPV